MTINHRDIAITALASLIDNAADESHDRALDALSDAIIESHAALLDAATRIHDAIAADLAPTRFADAATLDDRDDAAESIIAAALDDPTTIDPCCAASTAMIIALFDPNLYND